MSRSPAVKEQTLKKTSLFWFFLQLTVDTNKPPVNLAEIFPGKWYSFVLYLHYLGDTLCVISEALIP